jgi:hypothetical protein
MKPEQSSWSDIKSYREIVQKFLDDDALFDKFRAHSIDYNIILEHVSAAQGKAYDEFITKEYPDLIEFTDGFRLNESVGSPAKHEFKTFGLMSATTLRYIKMLGDIRRLCNYDKCRNIIEIGGGYGGLCRLWHQFKMPVSYMIADLPEVMKLQKKYLGKYGIDLKDYYDPPKDCHRSDLVISTFALNECERSQCKKYVYDIIAGAKNGYIVGLWIGGMSTGRDEILSMIGNFHLINVEPYLPHNGFDCEIISWRDDA